MSAENNRIDTKLTKGSGWAYFAPCLFSYASAL